jgi:hypothetical protein
MTPLGLKVADDKMKNAASGIELRGGNSACWVLFCQLM